MIPGLYSAATAMNASNERHQVVAENLAHINMPGYRRISLHQQPFEASMAEADREKFVFESLGTDLMKPQVDFTPGRYEQTGRNLDFAIHGEGFFVVEAEGQELYTRNGAFHTDQDGRLVTADGYPIAGQNGGIQLPPGTSPAMMSVGKDGTVRVGEQQVGQLKIVNFADPQQLQQRGVTLFMAPDGVQPLESEAMVQQGEREHSNVEPVMEMVELIAINRSHDAAKKALDSISESLRKRIDP